MHHVSRFVKRNAALLAFVVLAFFGCAAIYTSARDSAQKLYVSQIQGCQRSNSLRREINHRAAATDITKTVVIEFLRGAQTAREATYAQFHVRSDKVAAQTYGRLADKESNLHYGHVTITNCKAAIHHP